jgi:hypothetical protein
MADWTMSHMVTRLRDDRFLRWGRIVMLAGFIGGGIVLAFTSFLIAMVPVLVGCTAAMVLLIFSIST